MMEIYVADTTSLRHAPLVRDDGSVVSFDNITKVLDTFAGATKEASECWYIRRAIERDGTWGKVIVGSEGLGGLPKGTPLYTKETFNTLDEVGYPSGTVVAAEWAEHGFVTLEAADEIYAASLMCTTAGDLLLADLKLPAPVVLFRAPTSLLDFEFLRLATGLGRCSLELRRPNYFIRGIADTLTDLLIDEPPESEGTPSWAEGPRREHVAYPNPEERRIFNLARHYVLGLLLAYPTKSNWKYQGLRLAQAKKLRGYAPEHRVYLLSRSVRADVREGVKRYLSGGARSTPTTQWLVRGHYRNQSHGPSHSLRRVQWIEPYWKGDEDAPVRVRALKM